MAKVNDYIGLHNIKGGDIDFRNDLSLINSTQSQVVVASFSFLQVLVETPLQPNLFTP